MFRNVVEKSILHICTGFKEILPFHLKIFPLNLCLEIKNLLTVKNNVYEKRQTLFFFTEDDCKEAEVDERPALIFLRSCEIHSLKRIDDIYLRNGFEDIYYKKMRERAKFVLIG